jgi:phosphoglycolate phosphatase
VAETGRSWADAVQIAAAAFEEAESYLKPKAVYTPLLTGIGDWLADFAATDVKLGILSADTSENVRDFIKTHGLESKIQTYQSVDGDISKPDPRLYTALCHQLEVLPEQTLMVGDSTLDMMMAQAAGSAGRIGVTWGWKMPVAIAQADCLIDIPNQLRLRSVG